MPHPLPALAVAAAAPLLGLALHVASAHATGSPAASTAILPNNLCASCHGGGRVVSIDGGVLDARDLVALRTYLQDAPRG